MDPVRPTRIVAASLITLALGSVGAVVVALPAPAADSGYTLSVVAGRGRAVHAGPASESTIAATSVATDPSGNLYVADANGYVEKVTPGGTLSVLAGNGRPPEDEQPTPGPATGNALSPTAVAVDTNGNVYIGDSRGYVLEVAPSGVLSVAAGNGVSGDPTPGAATSSPLGPPNGVAVDAGGNLYIGDSNGYLEKVTPSGMLSVLAGDGTYAAPSPGPAADSTVHPTGVATDASGNVYVADLTGYVEKITPGGTLSIVAGNGHTTDATGPTPGPATASAVTAGGVDVDAGGALYIADGHGYIAKVTSTGTLSVIAGTGNVEHGGPTPGPAASSAVAPNGVALDGSGNLYVADLTYGFVEKVTPGGTLSLVAGTGSRSVDPTPGVATDSVVSPNGTAVDAAGNLYIADANGYVAKVTPGGALTVVAGNGTDGNATGPTPGPATQSAMYPSGVAVDASGNLYIADGYGWVEKVTPSGTLSVVAGNGEATESTTPTPGPATQSGMWPEDIAVDASGNLYIADAHGYIEKVTPSGTLSVVAGNGGYTDTGPPAPGPATASVVGTSGVAVDASGNLYLADGRGYVEKVTPGGILSVVAGNGTAGAPTPGPATGSAITPSGIAVGTDGTLYVADASGYAESVAPDGTLSVIAGNGAVGLPTPGAATASALEPFGIAVDAAATVYVADSLGIDKLTPPDRNTPTTPGASTTPTTPATPGGGTTQPTSFTVTTPGHGAGKAKVGKTLTATPATLSPTPTAISYQWRRGAKAIKKATKATYKLTKADRRKKISVTITYTRTGLPPLVQTLVIAKKVK
ncbi:MAG: hypothetical protein QM572_11180 [Nocardioides sp.]|uniref:hypothetical protein n=1 Tax=Nocardioides sp. TaxID=35761 RepID=UPI0039E269CE